MLNPGKMIAGYEILGLLGRGGMSIVYEARQVSLNRVVALKILSQELVDEDGVFRERFERESEIQANLESPNIVPIIEAGESENGLWLAMRLIRGGTLRELIDARGLTPEQTLAILVPIAGALDLAHQEGLIHRDMTPRNILVDESGDPYLADFGITKRRGDRSLTKPGQFVGTIEYVAPEQIKDEPAAQEADVYSLAAIAFECLSGRVPFEREDETAILYAHLIEEPPRVSEVAPRLPEGLDPVLCKGLAKQPADRYHQASKLLADISGALAVAAEEPAAEAVPSASSQRTGNGRWPAVMAAVVLYFLAVGLGAGAVASDDSPEEGSERASAGALAVTVPAGWSAASAKASGVLGLSLASPLVLRSRGGGEEVAVVGISGASGRTLLPPQLTGPGGGPPHGSPVSLGQLQALRYQQLRSTQGGEPLAVFVSPVSGGVATVACRPAGVAAARSGPCARIAASLRLKQGDAYALGPSAVLAQALRRQLTVLDQRRAKLRQRLGSATGVSGQAAAALELGAAYREAARKLSRVEVTPQSSAALEFLVSQMRVVGGAYRALAAAAEDEDEGSYADAAGEVSAAEDGVERRVRGLRRLGYRVVAPGAA